MTAVAVGRPMSCGFWFSGCWYRILDVIRLIDSLDEVRLIVAFMCAYYIKTQSLDRLKIKDIIQEASSMWRYESILD